MLLRFRSPFCIRKRIRFMQFFHNFLRCHCIWQADIADKIIKENEFILCRRQRLFLPLVGGFVSDPL